MKLTVYFFIYLALMVSEMAIYYSYRSGNSVVPIILCGILTVLVTFVTLLGVYELFNRETEEDL